MLRPGEIYFQIFSLTQTDTHKGYYRHYIQCQKTKGNKGAWAWGFSENTTDTHLRACTHTPMCVDNELLLYSSSNWQNKIRLNSVKEQRMKSVKLIYLTHPPQRKSLSVCLFPLHHSILFNCCFYWSCYTPHYTVLVVIDGIIVLQAYWINNASIYDANLQAR